MRCEATDDRRQVRARKRFGQHFLTAPEIIDQIARAVAPKAGDVVLEIGPGRGALTERLLESRARLIAIELDRDLVPLLRSRYPQLEVVEGDALTVDLAALQLPDAYRVTGNLPYNISTPLIFRLLEQPVRDMHFMLQREVVQRLAAEPGSKRWGRLGIMAQLRCEVEPLFDVPPEAFAPPPKVWSQVVRLTPRQPRVHVPEGLDPLLRRVFSNRRKRLGNSLREFTVDYGALGIDPNLRPDVISLPEFLKLVDVIGAEALGG